MKVIDPGHHYLLGQLDAVLGAEFAPGWPGGFVIPGQANLIFVKREGDDYPGNDGLHPGTTCQEVIRALIDRVKYLDNQIHDDRNARIIRNLRECIWIFETRAADRHLRNWSIGGDLDFIEFLPTCSKCLHIGCDGRCHPGGET